MNRIMAHLMKEVTLILCSIDALEQRRLCVALTFSHVVPSRDLIGTQNMCVVEEGAKLNLFIAKDIGIRCPASFILR